MNHGVSDRSSTIEHAERIRLFEVPEIGTALSGTGVTGGSICGPRANEVVLTRDASLNVLRGRMIRASRRARLDHIWNG